MRHTISAVSLLGVLAAAMPAGASEPSPPAMTAAGAPAGEPRTGGAPMGHVMRRPFGPTPVITLALRHRAELGLSPEQVERLEQLRLTFMREAIRRGADLRIAEVDLAALQRADRADLAQVEAKLQEIERLRATLRLSQIRTIEEGKGELTPEQRAKLRTLAAAGPGGHRRGHPAFGPGSRQL